MYVYILKDNKIPFYIGVGTGDRYISHENFAKNLTDLGYGLTKDYNPYKTRKIQKMLREGRKIKYDFEYFGSKSAAFDREIELISFYGRKNIDKNGILTNITKGGTGGNCIEHMSDEEYKLYITKISNGIRKAYSERKTEIIEKIKTTKKKNGTWAKLTDEQYRKIKIANKKRCIKQRIKILQCDENMSVLKQWNSMSEAAKNFSTSQGSISNAIKNNKTAAGYHWRKDQ